MRNTLTSNSEMLWWNDQQEKKNIHTHQPTKSEARKQTEKEFKVMWFVCARDWKGLLFLMSIEKPAQTHAMQSNRSKSFGLSLSLSRLSSLVVFFLFVFVYLCIFHCLRSTFLFRSVFLVLLFTGDRGISKQTVFFRALSRCLSIIGYINKFLFTVGIKCNVHKMDALLLFFLDEMSMSTRIGNKFSFYLV